MNKLYLFFTSILSTLIFSQTILNQSESTTRTVSDPNAVILAPGFNAKWNVVDPFVAKIGASSNNPSNPTNSDAGSTNPSGSAENTILKFHDTQGSIDVNGGGQLQYTLAIALPPGVKSVAPQINLIYASGGGNGIAGYGWNISGITAISRVGRTIEKDGEVRGVKLDYSDYYSFNGQRLIYKGGGNGSYGSDGAEYVTEKYSNVKIKSIGSLSGLQWQGPEYWEVTFEDGSQAWYGATTTGASNARTPVEYNIAKWKDAQGNYIKYTYSNSNNVSIIRSIQWGGNETINKPFFNEIIFDYYEIRDLKEFSYLNGVLFEQNALLSSIQVKTNGSQFKKYVITYANDIVNNNNAQTINYQFVQSIQEFNSQNEPANPVGFSTDALTTKIEERPFVDFENVITSGDYNGDGLSDFIVKQPAQNGRPEGYYLYFDKLNNESAPFLYLGSSSSLPNLTAFIIKTTNNIVKPRQGLLTVKNIDNPSNPQSNGGIEIKRFSINLDTSLLNTFNNPLILENSNFIEPSGYQATSYTNFPPANYGYYIKSEATSPKEIDINLDGIPELVFTIFDKGYYKRQSPAPYEWVSVDLGYRYIVVDYDDFTTNSNIFTKINTPTTTNILESTSVMDFDNDKVQDIIKIEYPNYNNYANTNVTFYTKNKYSNAIIQRTVNTPISVVSQYNIKRNGSGSNKYIIQLKQQHFIKGLRNEIKFGDLNGDGNIEIITPLEKNFYGDSHIAGWSFYLNNGKTLSEFCQGFAEYYDENPISNGYFQRSQNGVIDIDNDGKSDFLHFYSGYNTQGNGFSNLFLYKYSEFQYDISNNQFRWSYKLSNLITNQRGGTTMFPIYGDFRINSSNSKILFISKSISNSSDRKIISFKNYSLGIDKNIKTITQGGLITNIDYKELDPAINPGLYAPVKAEQYPYLELDKVSQSYVVSQLRQEGRKQDFKYRGYLMHLQGKGILGFRQVAKSSWYADGFENTVVWGGAEIDPLNESVPIKEWSVKTYNDNNLIFPTDISENNNQLLSYKKTDYQTDIISNNLKAIIPWKTKSKDFLKDITTDSEITYGNYYLPAQTNTSINGGFATSQTIMTYVHNPSGTGKDYYIGRPSSKSETTTAYGDTKVTAENFDYVNNQLDKVTKKPSATSRSSIVESYKYDGWGNVTEKKTSFVQVKINPNPSLTQIEKAEYDDKGRFVIKKTDNLALETNITYNDWGQVLTQTDPLGVVLTNTYDEWGKLLTSKTNLAGTTTYTYAKDSFGGSIVTQYDPDGNVSKKYTNKLGQNYKTQTKGFGQNTTKYIAKYKLYDALGRAKQESEPYFDLAAEEAPSNAKWNLITYDDSVFPAKATATSFNGKQMQTSVSGRTTTVKELNGNLRTNTKTTDALGNVITSTDKGGTITFAYNAAGQQITATYGSNVVTTAYDLWGRKTEFTDPSNGTYTYDYDGFGRILLETSPKGTKEYIYNNFGQLYKQNELSGDGTSTNKSITYAYNPAGLVTSKTGTANGRAYSSVITYDAYGRVISTSENSNGKYFMKKGITYDDVMRVTSYEKSLYSSGTYTKVTIENVYDPWNGELYQVKDKNQNKVLWELQTTNSNGQVTNAKLGNASVYNIYDSNNFIANATHKNLTDNTTVLQLNYSFNAIKNELNSRTRGGAFNISESFQYDDNNRLVNWTDPATGLFTQNAVRNSYDDKGRILNNDQVGEIKFNNNNKIYQATGMVLNTAGQQNYNANLLQKITYNENNDPIFIDGLKGDVAFTYGLSEMRQTATYGGNFDADGTGKYTKYYSEDGSYEIVKDNQTGYEKHLLYIGGTPYESNIVFIKQVWNGGNYHFLHKDYLGSILAVTTDAGMVLEQRHYDAWGNFTHFKTQTQDITGVQQVTDYLANNSLLIDRGYTSHEHFSEVGLIHMNGRLYDPLLRRFLNADENIQDMFNTQNYNKYGYVMNNPLLYNDPSGEFAFILPVFAAMSVFWGTVATAAAIAVMVGYATYIIQAAYSNNFSWGGFAKSLIFSGVSGAATAGIGSVFTNSVGTLTALASSIKGSIGGVGLAIVQAGTHSISQGVLSLVQGGSFMNGAAAGFFGSLGASAWVATAGSSGVSMIAFGALSGGVGSELAGGNFWRGALIGGVVAGLNHAMHEIGNPMDDNSTQTQQQKEPWDLNGDGKLQKNEADNWWLNGKGQQVDVDNSKIDWSGLEMPLNKPVGSNFSVETHVAFEDLPYETASTYGGTSFQRTGYREAKVLDQKYHYDYRPNNSAKNVVRNFMNWAGKPSGQGVDYMIHYINPTIKFK